MVDARATFAPVLGFAIGVGRYPDLHIKADLSTAYGALRPRHNFLRSRSLCARRFTWSSANAAFLRLSSARSAEVSFLGSGFCPDRAVLLNGQFPTMPGCESTNPSRRTTTSARHSGHLVKVAIQVPLEFQVMGLLQDSDPGLVLLFVRLIRRAFALIVGPTSSLARRGSAQRHRCADRTNAIPRRATLRSRIPVGQAETQRSQFVRPRSPGGSVLASVLASRPRGLRIRPRYGCCSLSRR